MHYNAYKLFTLAYYSSALLIKHLIVVESCFKLTLLL